MRNQRKQSCLLISSFALIIIVIIAYGMLRHENTTNLYNGGQREVIQMSRLSSTDDVARSTPINDCITGKQLGHITANDVKATRLGSRMTTDEMTENRNQSQKLFEDIYEKDLFNGGASRSGPGSTVEYKRQATKILDGVIERIKGELDVKRIKMLDVPCGDMTWMKLYLGTRDDVDYTGYDIVSQLISKHRNEFSDRPWQFHNRDVIADGLKERFDLVFSRDMLQHLYNADVLKFLYVVSESGSGFLLVTSHVVNQINQDLASVESFRYHKLNLEAPPISLKPPLCYSKDGSDQVKYLALWTLPLFQIDMCREATGSGLPVASSGGTYYSCSAVATSVT